MSPILKYLIIVNLLSLVYETIDYFIYQQTGDEIPGPISNILIIIGGSLGALIAYLIWDRKLTKSNLQSRIYTVAWLILHIVLYIIFFGPNRVSNLAQIKAIYEKYKVLFIYLALINIATFVAFGIDKLKAIAGKWRIREVVLLGMALVGGSFGALLGMDIFNHKVKSPHFMVGVPLMLCVHLVLLALLVGGLL